MIDRKVNVFVTSSKSLFFCHLPEETYTVNIKFGIEHVCLAYSTLDFYKGGTQEDWNYGFPQHIPVNTRLVP